MAHFKFSLVSFMIFLSSLSYSQWNETGCGFENPQGLVFGVSVPQPGVVWGVLEEVGFFNFQTKAAVTIDDGATWNIYDIDTLSTFTCIKIKALDENTAFASTLTFPEEDSTRIYRTQDSGVSWQLIPTAFSGPYEACIDFHFFDDENGVAFGAPITGPLTIYTTADGGDTWSKVQDENLPMPDSEEGMVIMTGNGSYGASNDFLWFGTTSGRIYKTSDKGLTWAATTVDDTRSIHSVAFKDDLNGVAASIFSPQAASFVSNKCWTTNDGGDSWTEVNDVISSPGMDMITYVPGSDNTYVGTSSRSSFLGGSMISFDGGQSWTGIDGERIYGAEFLSETEGWAGGFTQELDEGIYEWEGYTLVEEYTVYNHLEIVPTLAQDFIKISNVKGSNAERVKLYSTNGHCITKTINSNTIDVSSLSSGVYQIVLDNDGKYYRGSFIKN